MLESARSRISDWNPQLVREIKGRWQGRNLSIAVVASALSQLLIYLGFREQLPSVANRVNRYCIGTPPADQLSAAQMHNPPNNYCLENTAGDLVVNWQLWWLDLFTWLTAAFIIVLLAAGTYLLISDLAKEEQRGTLSFVRLSPRSVSNLLIGKILGVPILIYTVMLLALPLHLAAGLAAEIPLSLIFGLYLVVVASCAFFFSAALLYGLVTTGLGSFQSWLGTGIVLLFLWLATMGGYQDSLVNHDPSDWLTLFYPGKVLPYLIGETPHSFESIGYFNLKDAMTLKWYNFAVWNHAGGAIALLILNYVWWTYWVWQGLSRRFHNPHATLLSKQKSYWFTGSITVSLLGFMTMDEYRMVRNFQFFFTIELVVFLLLIVALSPHRQTLQDWARYRHQKNSKATRNLFVDLMRGEQSPANGAIALNLLSNALIILPAVIFLPLGSDRAGMLASVVSVSSVFLAYACLAQLVLLMKTQKRSIFAIISVSSLMFVPTMVGGILGLPAVVTFAFFPVAMGQILGATGFGFVLLAQWVVIVGSTMQLTRQLKQAGESNSKALFAEENRKGSILS